MFYQNNNDYMRDAFLYSTPQNSTYQSGYVNSFTPMNNMQAQPLQGGVIPTNIMPNNAMTMNQFGINPMGNNMTITQQGIPSTTIASMYPQIYRIINPVANRVISNSNYQYLTEDSLNNMVDTVFNIVEGDISTLATTMPSNSGDDTITQGSSRTSQQASSSTTNNNANSLTGNSRQTAMTESNRSSSSTTVMSQNNNRGDNQLLRDLIKIIIIKELLSRQTGGFAMENSRNTQMNNSNFTGFTNTNTPNSFFDPRIYSLI